MYKQGYREIQVTALGILSQYLVLYIPHDMTVEECIEFVREQTNDGEWSYHGLQDSSLQVFFLKEVKNNV